MGRILGTVGIADKGVYSADVTYMAGNFVYYNGSTWLARRDGLQGVTPREGTDWKYLARGFDGQTSSIVVMEEDIPVSERTRGTWYLNVTNRQTLSGSEENIKSLPNMGLRVIEKAEP